MSVTLSDLQDEIVRFRDDRNWQQFHNPKDMALSLTLEAAELMEQFQWKNNEECLEHLRNHTHEVADEMADVLYWLLLMSHDFKIDLLQALSTKLVQNANKYPVDKAKNNHKKYTEFN